MNNWSEALVLKHDDLLEMLNRPKLTRSVTTSTA